MARTKKTSKNTSQPDKQSPKRLSDAQLDRMGKMVSAIMSEALEELANDENQPELVRQRYREELPKWRNVRIRFAEPEKPEE